MGTVSEVVCGDVSLRGNHEGIARGASAHGNDNSHSTCKK